MHHHCHSRFYGIGKRSSPAVVQGGSLVMKCGLYVASIWIMCSLNKTHNPHNPD